jgi:hypothetical protein
VHLDKRANDRKAEPQAAGNAVDRLLALHEEVEHMRNEARLDAHPLVADFDPRAVPAACEAQPDDARVRRELGGVDEQVRHNLRKPGLVALHEACRGRLDRERARAPLEHRTRELDRLGDHVAQIHAVPPQHDLALCDPGDIQEIVDQAREMPYLALDDAALCDAVAGRAFHDFQRHDDRRERIAQLVPRMPRNSSLARFARSASWRAASASA